MILERLTVRALGRFREPVDLQFDDGFNVVLGKNEAGKSTLVRALHHALFTPYGSSALEVRDLVPWGTELSPEVAVEFRICGERFRLVKSFLNQARCVLAEWDGSRFRDVVDGDGAEQRVRSFLLGERPGSGAAQEKHRGLARLLWIPQGETALPELEGDVRRRIEQSLDAITLDEGEGRLHAAIAEAFSGIWAKNGRSFVKSSGLPGLEEELEQLRRQREELEAYLLSAEQTSKRLEDLEAELSQLEAERSATAEAIRALEGELDRVRRLKMRHLKEQAEYAEARRELDRLLRERDRLRVLKAEARAAAEVLASEIEPKLEQARTALEEASARRDEMRRELVAAEQRVKDARLAWQRARRLREAIECEAAIAAKARIAREVESLDRERNALCDRLLAMPNPTEAHIKRARALESTLQQLNGRLEAAGLRVTFAAEREVAGSVRTDGGEVSGFQVRAGERREVRAIRSIEWRLEGVGAFCVESGADEAASIERERDRTASELEELLRPFGADSADALLENWHERRKVEEQKSALENRVKQALRDEGSLDNLKSAVAELERRVAVLCQELAVERTALGAMEPPDASRAEEAYLEAESAHIRIGQELDAQGARVDKLRAQVSSFEQERAVKAQQKKSAEDGVSQLLAGYGSEEALLRACSVAEARCLELESRVREIAALLPPDEKDPEREAARLKAAQAELDKEHHERSVALAKLEQQLENIADDGVYAALARVEESLRLKEEQYQREVRRAKAIKLLKVLADTRQRRMIDQLTGPVSARVTRYFEQVTGEVGRRIRFDGKLRPAAMDVGRTEGLSTEALSTGAREQLHVLSRLALARYLASRNGRMLFVLDDSLVNADASRRRRFLDLLLEAQVDLQIVLLTCHAEWLRGLEGVRRLTLETG